MEHLISLRHCVFPLPRRAAIQNCEWILEDKATLSHTASWCMYSGVMKFCSISGTCSVFPFSRWNTKLDWLPTCQFSSLDQFFGREQVSPSSVVISCEKREPKSGRQTLCCFPEGSKGERQISNISSPSPTLSHTTMQASFVARNCFIRARRFIRRVTLMHAGEPCS